MRMAKTLGILFASAVMASASVPAVYAQGEGGGGGVYGGGSVGATWMRAGMAVAPRHLAGTNQDCPGIMWHITRGQPGADGTVPLSGPIWYSNNTGLSMAMGQAQRDGTFSLDVKPASGNGPLGTVTGKRNRDGSLDVNFTGGGCSNFSGHINPGQTSIAHG